MKKLILLLIVITIQSCGIFRVNSGIRYNKSEIIKIDFCELGNYNNKLIKTKLEYTGFEEYWSAKGFSGCELNNEVNLNFEEFSKNDKDFLIDSQLRKLYNNQSTHKAVMIVVGVIKIDSVQGFGHLNTYPAELLIKSVKINVKKKQFIKKDLQLLNSKTKSDRNNILPRRKRYSFPIE